MATRNFAARDVEILATTALRKMQERKESRWEKLISNRIEFVEGKRKSWWGRLFYKAHDATREGAIDSLREDDGWGSAEDRLDWSWSKPIGDMEQLLKLAEASETVEMINLSDEEWDNLRGWAK